MSLATILAGMKTINAAISGVTSSYDITDVPASLSTGNLPAAVVLPSPTEMTTFTLIASRRTTFHQIVLRIYVEPIAQGTVAQNLTAVEPFIERVADRYSQAIAIDSLAGIQRHDLDGYRIGVLPDFAGVDYIGIEFPLMVREIRTVTTDG